MSDNFVVKDSGERIDYKSGMRRDTQKGKPNFRLIDLGFLKRLAMHLTKGAEKYGRDNWRLANSQEELDRFQDSAFRHLTQWLNGEIDEDHAMAVVFNIMAAEWVKNKLEKPTPRQPIAVYNHDPKIVPLKESKQEEDLEVLSRILRRLNHSAGPDARVSISWTKNGLINVCVDWGTYRVSRFLDPLEIKNTYDSSILLDLLEADIIETKNAL